MSLDVLISEKLFGFSFPESDKEGELRRESELEELVSLRLELLE